MNDEGCIPKTSPKGFNSVLCGGGLIESVKLLPLHEAVRLEKEPLSLLPFLDMLFMLANLGIDMEDGVVGDWNDSLFREAEEGFCTSLFTGAASTGCSTVVDTGEGTKNLGFFPPPIGLMEATGGDWKVVAAFPPPLLKVSTYLSLKHTDISSYKT